MPKQLQKSDPTWNNALTFGMEPSNIKLRYLNQMLRKPRDLLGMTVWSTHNFKAYTIVVRLLGGFYRICFRDLITICQFYYQSKTQISQCHRYAGKPNFARFASTFMTFTDIEWHLRVFPDVYYNL